MIMTNLPPKKTYASPKLTKLTFKEAELLLQAQAEEGSQEAKDLLNLLLLDSEVKA